MRSEINEEQTAVNFGGAHSQESNEYSMGAVFSLSMVLCAILYLVTGEPAFSFLGLLPVVLRAAMFFFDTGTTKQTLNHETLSN